MALGWGVYSGSDEGILILLILEVARASGVVVGHYRGWSHQCLVTKRAPLVVMAAAIVSVEQ